MLISKYKIHRYEELGTEKRNTDIMSSCMFKLCISWYMLLNFQDDCFRVSLHSSIHLESTGLRHISRRAYTHTCEAI
jgi:hypothetical protein